MQYVIHFDAKQTNAEKLANEVVVAGGVVHTKSSDYLVANLEFSQRNHLVKEVGVVSVETEQYGFFE